MLKIIIIIILLFSFLSSKKDYNHTSNLFENYNPHCYTTKKMNNLKFHKYITTDTATPDGSGCILLAPHRYFHWFKSEKIFLEKNQAYTVHLFIKMKSTKKRKNFRGQNIMIGMLGNSKWRPSYWNVSKENQWEEVLFQFIAEKSKSYRIGIATFQNSLIQEKYNISNQSPPLANSNNLDKSIDVYLDDIFIEKTREVRSLKERTKKTSFLGEKVKIDQLGNWSVKNNGKWKAIFPKFIYPGNPYIDKSKKNNRNFISYYPASKYAKHGFNGLMNPTYEGYIENAILDSKGKIKYFSKQLNTLERFKGKKKDTLSFKHRMDSVLKYLDNVKNDNLAENNDALYLMHFFDNENSWLRDYKFRDELEVYLKKIDWDKNKQARKVPIYMLNGTYGTSRANRNEYRNIMDITGSYVGGDTVGDTLNIPIATLDILDEMQYQIVPASFIQLQCYYHDKFIPSLFYGIIQGGRAVAVWKDGTTYKGCKQDFTKNSWAVALRGKDSVFLKIDKMLGIIQSDRHKVTWRVIFNDVTLKVGKRNYNNKHYLILANYSNKEKVVKLKVKDISVTNARDFFTKKRILGIKDGTLSIEIGKNNIGYRVIEFY